VYIKGTLLRGDDGDGFIWMCTRVHGVLLGFHRIESSHTKLRNKKHTRKIVIMYILIYHNEDYTSLSISFIKWLNKITYQSRKSRKVQL